MVVRSAVFTSFLAIVGLQVGADVVDYELIQPKQGDSGVILYSRTGNARIETGNGLRKRLPVRRDETLTTVAEVGMGWLMTGTRDKATRREIVMISAAGSSVRRLTAPNGQSEPFRVRPTPILGTGSELEGLAWLEGADLKSLSVRFSHRQSSEWSDVVEIAPATRGSQSGLTATVLADGSWLLVWAAFDGNDDDLFFSQIVGESISRPARVLRNNGVPDIMPSLIASDTGALLAWSQLEEGHYRVKVSYFDGGAWSGSRTHGPPGAQRAELIRHNDDLRLVYQQAWPRGWNVSEIDGLGRTERRAEFPVSSHRRPALTRSIGGTLEMRWPGLGSREAEWTPAP